MTWTEIGQDHLNAAKLLTRKHLRSAISRAYYAAHSVLTERLEQRGWAASPPRQTPAHYMQAQLVKKHLGDRRIRTLISRLYQRRLDADYDRLLTVESTLAVQAVREASMLFVRLGVSEMSR